MPYYENAKNKHTTTLKTYDEKSPIVESDLQGLLDVYKFNAEHNGYRHLEDADGTWSPNNMNNALFAFSNWCAFKNRKEIERSGIIGVMHVPSIHVAALMWSLL